MPDLLLTSKFRIPTLHRNLVNRPQLIRRLDEGIVHHSRLILVTAPPGYGKSTLLTEWVSQVDYPVSWLTIEKGANNPARFWGYFVNALRTIPSLHQANLGEALVQALQTRLTSPMAEVLTDFANELSEIEGKIILVVDDLHDLTESRIHKDLVFLIERLPLTVNGLHLVVSSRIDPPWPLARWRAFNELTELRASDLRFSIEEVSRLLNQTLQLGLSSRDIATLQLRTEGWIAGLQMAALTIQGRLKEQGSVGVAHFVKTFSGTNRFILDYLMEEVIDQQTTEMRDFLLATSILEQFNAPLCDALLNRHDSQSILVQAEQANLFLVPLDDERRWFRYHQLFVSLLVTNFKQIHPEQVAGLHQRASKWYAENDFLSEAICHAIDAGDIMLVNEYVSGNALGMIEYGELLDVQKHFEDIPEQQFHSKPWLCVAYAWVKAYTDPSGGLNQNSPTSKANDGGHHKNKSGKPAAGLPAGCNSGICGLGHRRSGAGSQICRFGDEKLTRARLENQGSPAQYQRPGMAIS